VPTESEIYAAVRLSSAGLIETGVTTVVGQIIAVAAEHRLPVMSNVKEHVVAGALMSYGTSLPDLHRQATIDVDKILKGAKPGELPVQQPMKFDLVINLKTAQTLGLTIPPSILFQADEMIR
jgi:putative tryptophan/tyrosine transport system substrate-binding protein